MTAGCCSHLDLTSLIWNIDVVQLSKGGRRWGQMDLNPAVAPFVASQCQALEIGVVGLELHDLQSPPQASLRYCHFM